MADRLKYLDNFYDPYCRGLIEGFVTSEEKIPEETPQKILQMPQVRQYTDYRKYLRDLYEYRKKGNIRFTFDYIAQQLKTSRAYFKNIIDGRRHISMDRVMKIADIFNLQEYELDYFTMLFLQGSATDPRLQARFDYILRALAGLIDIIPHHAHLELQDDSGNYITTNWLAGTLFEMVRMDGFEFNSTWIQSHLTDGATTSLQEIETVMARLWEMELIIECDGKYLPGKEVLQRMTPYNPREAMKVYRNSAAKTYQVLEDATRYRPCRFLNASFVFDAPRAHEVVLEFDQFQKRITELSRESEKPDRVYYFSNNMFTLAKTPQV